MAAAPAADAAMRNSINHTMPRTMRHARTQTPISMILFSGIGHITTPITRIIPQVLVLALA